MRQSEQKPAPDRLLLEAALRAVRRVATLVGAGANGGRMVSISHRALQKWRRWRVPATVSFAGPVALQEGISFRGGELIQIGPNAVIFRRTELHSPLTIGANCFINHDVVVRAGCAIGNNVAIGPRAFLSTDHHDIGPSTYRAGRIERKPITIGDGVWIGANALILPGLTIGAGSVVAAGAVVTRDVPPNTLVAGVPARPLRTLD